MTVLYKLFTVVRTAWQAEYIPWAVGSRLLVKCVNFSNVYIAGVYKTYFFNMNSILEINFAKFLRSRLRNPVRVCFI